MRRIPKRIPKYYEGGPRSLLIGFLFRLHKDCRSCCPEIKKEAQEFQRHDPCFGSVREYLGFNGPTDAEIINRVGRD